MVDVVYLCRDLLFTSKIREVAGQLGCRARSAVDPAALVKAVPGARLVVLDLRMEGALDALDALVADPACASVPRVGFVDHEKMEMMETARRRGCTYVLTKGQFAKDLPRLVRDGP